jgi:hypothetical protein
MEHSLFLAETRISDSARSLLPTERRLHLVYEFALPNYAMQRSALVGTPLAGTASGVQIVGSASGAPTTRRR